MQNEIISLQSENDILQNAKKASLEKS